MAAVSELDLPRLPRADASPLDIFTSAFHRRAWRVDDHDEGGAQPALVPSPDAPETTFYRTRREALSQRGYPSTMTHADSVVIALDAAAGGGAKMFNIMPRHRLLDFVLSLPPTRRNVYVLVDPDVPCDAFFDIDAHWDAGAAAGSSDSTAMAAAFDNWRLALLDAVLPILLGRLEVYFQVKVRRVAAFDSSDPVKRKASFHVHIVMSDGMSFRGISEHNQFCKTHLHARTGPNKKSRAEAAAGGDGAVAETHEERAHPASSAIDLAVYTSWRPFRLPHCSKRLANGAVGASFERVVPEALKEGSTARAILMALEAVSDRDAFDMSCIGLPSARRAEACHVTDGQTPVPAAAAAIAGAAEALRTGVRRPVTDRRCDTLLALFQSIDPHFAGTGGIDRLCRCEYEDNGQIRMYYAYQKQSRWCVKQQRAHRSTHAQLYVTFGSIKVRCYSNDCYESCTVIPWTDETIALREALFPGLSEDELRIRYPHLYGATESTTNGGDDAEDDSLLPDWASQLSRPSLDTVVA